MVNNVVARGGQRDTWVARGEHLGGQRGTLGLPEGDTWVARGGTWVARGGTWVARGDTTVDNGESILCPTESPTVVVLPPLP